MKMTSMTIEKVEAKLWVNIKSTSYGIKTQPSLPVAFKTSCKTMPETWQTLTDYDRDIILGNGIQQEKWVPMTSRTSADLKYYTFKTM